MLLAKAAAIKSFGLVIVSLGFILFMRASRLMRDLTLRSGGEEPNLENKEFPENPSEGLGTKPLVRDKLGTEDEKGPACRPGGAGISCFRRFRSGESQPAAGDMNPGLRGELAGRLRSPALVESLFEILLSSDSSQLVGT